MQKEWHCFTHICIRPLFWSKNDEQKNTWDDLPNLPTSLPLSHPVRPVRGWKHVDASTSPTIIAVVCGYTVSIYQCFAGLAWICQGVKDNGAEITGSSLHVSLVESHISNAAGKQTQEAPKNELYIRDRGTFGPNQYVFQINSRPSTTARKGALQVDFKFAAFCNRGRFTGGSGRGGNLEIQQFQGKIYYLPHPSGNQSRLPNKSGCTPCIYTEASMVYEGIFQPAMLHHRSVFHTHSVHVLPIIPGQWAAQASTRNWLNAANRE